VNDVFPSAFIRVPVEIEIGINRYAIYRFVVDVLADAETGRHAVEEVTRCICIAYGGRIETAGPHAVVVYPIAILARVGMDCVVTVITIDACVVAVRITVY
jgi:hypothetical protein